ncbi:MAG: hypothetical protein OEO20_05055 [Gemmatimonadota bacterium]|nr:hypothetical protein [Gemmatimonadota bacterium]MDH3366901.1 hypothetical protein [Gemmatimonadota bacterium]MDH3477652.1 hypothetical protein [Gemmatimonadota bacterium]MDH3568567.1 hypothetical protein [Gemmatimonadota bacterium]MDH5550698.1 hypothetical protein [Gemmatimonadota bacterium]
MRFVRFITAAAALTVVGVVLPAQALAQATAPAKKPPVLIHTTEDRANCMMCHSGKMQGLPAAPADHAERPNESCAFCHAADAAIQTKEPKAIPHALEGQANCLMCHSGKMANIPAPPAESHLDKGINDSKYCGYCHKVTS